MELQCGGSCRSTSDDLAPRDRETVQGACENCKGNGTRPECQTGGWLDTVLAFGAAAFVSCDGAVPCPAAPSTAIVTPGAAGGDHLCATPSQGRPVTPRGAGSEGDDRMCSAKGRNTFQRDREPGGWSSSVVPLDGTEPSVPREGGRLSLE